MIANVFKLKNGRKLFNYALFTRLCSWQSNAASNNLEKLRNIGILAHIDAGKTTTTERMLFYSGKIGQMGEVHHGNTVTDWMDQERKRGITITSAAVSFAWNGHQFNLIDTPGHIDFTMEVEQTLSVLDGAVVVLDGSAGVEAQTQTVWRQSDKYSTPRIIFLNKMDRTDADLEMCLNSIKSKLDTTSVCLNLPLKDDKKLLGIIDVLTLEKVIWSQDTRGRKYTNVRIDKETDLDLWMTTVGKRSEIVDLLSGFDDRIAEAVIKSENLESIPTVDIVRSIRKLTLDKKLTPVMCGSAYKNIAIQTLMNAIVHYLPSPFECNKHYQCFEDNFAAKIFKVQHHRQKGTLHYCRVYSGRVKKNQKIYNIQKEIPEHIGKVYACLADEFRECDGIECGNIGILTGLKQSVIGDVITQSATVANRAKTILESSMDPDSTLVTRLFKSGTFAPDPVFFCSVEPPSLKYAQPLEDALRELALEDPSLKVTFETETGQTVLGGMGELHLEIIKERIRTEYKIDVDFGPLQIAYKETPTIKRKDIFEAKHHIGNSTHTVTVTLSIVPNESRIVEKDVLKLDKSPENAAYIAQIYPRHLKAVRQGVEAALLTGPKLGCPIVGMSVVLHRLDVGRGTSETIISASVCKCIQQLLNKSNSVLLEPVMRVEVIAPQNYSSPVLNDISRRRAVIKQITNRGENTVIEAIVPLTELLGYSTTLRTITSGHAFYNMEFHEYTAMSDVDEQKAIQQVTGF